MDKDFFVQAIEAHSGSMYRVACAVLGPRDECRDALQETALKAWEKRHTLQLLTHFEIRKPLVSCRSQNEEIASQKIITISKRRILTYSICINCKFEWLHVFKRRPLTLCC